MPSGQPSRHEPSRPDAAPERPSEGSVGDDLAPDILGQVVAETASSLAGAKEANPVLQSALEEVARRLAGQPMTLDPAGTALLEAVIRVQFPLLAERPALLAKTARTVAATLLADPAARLRVEHVWARLAEDAV
jgi:hypothetical protein